MLNLRGEGMGMNHPEKGQKVSLNDPCLCILSNQICIYQSSEDTPDTRTQTYSQRASYQKMIMCLNCPIFKSNISNNPKLSFFLNSIGNQLIALMQKIELDQMIFNKQKSSLESIMRATEDHKIEKKRLEEILQKRIQHYKSLLSKRAIYLDTLQNLSTIIGQINEPDMMWQRASMLLINHVLDLEAIGLLILDQNCMLKRRFTALLPLRLAALIDDCYNHGSLLSRFTDKKGFISLYKIYWEDQAARKRVGPRTEDMLERCLLLPVNGHHSPTGIFIVLMKNLSTSMDELEPFFSIAARLIEEGIISVS